MNALVVCLLAVGACSAVPLFSPFSVQYHSQDELGQYSYGYSGGPSAKHEVKTFDGVTRGGYSYIDSNGVIQSASYVADPFNGFRVAATNIPVGPAPVAPVVAAPVVPAPVPQQVVDTPEVAAAKAAHFAAHAEARSRLRRSAPLKPDGTVDDTVEVKAAKAAHFAAQAGYRSLPLVYNPLFYSGYYPYAPLNADGTVAETPEVVAAKSAHFAAHAVARGGLPYAYSPLLYRGYWPYAAAPLNVDGTVAETPEVVAAKAAHFAAHVEARSRSRRSAPLKPDGSVDDTLEVKLAKAAHFDAVARERGILPYYSPLVARAFPFVYPTAYSYYPYAPLNIDGTVAETPEVVSAKIAHFAAHAEARSRARRQVTLRPDGTVDDTPEVKVAKLEHYAAKARATGVLPYIYGYPYSVYPYAGVAKTPEVVAAELSHFAAHARANTRLIYGY